MVRKLKLDGILLIVASLLLVGNAQSAMLRWTASAECTSVVAPDYIDVSTATQVNQNAVASAHAYDTSNIIGTVMTTGSIGSQTSSNNDGDIFIDSKLTASFQKKDWYFLADYFYQEAYTVIDANYVATHDPNGAICGIEYEVIFPINNIVGGDTAWKLDIQGPFSAIETGYNYEDGHFGFNKGMITAITGEPVKVILQHAVGGIFDDFGGDNMANGVQQIRVILHQIDHPADINTDGAINIGDFNSLSSRWNNTACDPNTACGRADINHSGQVDSEDLFWLSYYWLIDN